MMEGITSMLRSRLLCLCLALACANNCCAREIRFESNQSLDFSSGAKKERVPLHLLSGADVYIFTDDNSPFKASTQAGFLSIAMDAKSRENTKQKALLSIFDHKTSLIGADGRHSLHISMKIKLGKQFENPDLWCILMQAFQGGQKHPPFTMKVEPSPNANGPVAIMFDYRNDYIEQQLTDKAISERTITFGRTQIDRDRWYLIEINLQPDAEITSRGLIDIRIDSKPLTHMDVRWGYKVLGADRFIGFDVGLYRHTQDRFQNILLSNISVN